MTAFELFISQFKYKPYVKILAKSKDGQHKMTLSFSVIDSHTGVLGIVEHVNRIDDYVWYRMRDPHRKQWVQKAIEQAEVHESREFLKYNGELLIDPHADEKR